MDNERLQAMDRLAAAEGGLGCCRLGDCLPSLARRLALASHLLLGLDYDGTLTPLVEDPSQAKLAPETRKILRALAAQPDTTVAIISGRSLEDLRGQVDLDGLIYAGNHGLDISGPGLRFVEPMAVEQQGALAELSRTLALRLQSVAGAFVEDKTLTISVHFRRVAAHEVDNVRRVVEETMAQDNFRFRMTLGHKVFEVYPRVGWNKGLAMKWIKDQIGNSGTLVLYLGDDETDEDVFHAMPGEVTIKVGIAADTCANYRVETPVNVRELLYWLHEISPKGD